MILETCNACYLDIPLFHCSTRMACNIRTQTKTNQMNLTRIGAHFNQESYELCQVPPNTRYITNRLNVPSNETNLFATVYYIWIYYANRSRTKCDAIFIVFTMAVQ